MATLLHVDREYRAKAIDDCLPIVSPHTADSKTASLVPVLHTGREGWYFTALYSNTASARARNRINDWVVIYYYDGAGNDGQVTVVSELRGPMRGKRVVRGRDETFQPHYALDEDGPRFPGCRRESFTVEGGNAVL